MARKAQAEAEEKAIELKQPDFEKALQLMTSTIKPSEEKNASARGDLSGAWKRIEEDFHCNKGGAKLFYRLQQMSAEKRDDFLRTLYGFMRLSGMGIRRDLVDAMQSEGGDDSEQSVGMPVSAAPAGGLATLPN